MATPPPLAGSERNASMDRGAHLPAEGGQPPTMTSTETNVTGTAPPPSTENPDLTSPLDTE